MSALRESGDGHLSPVKPTTDFDGLTRAAALRGLLDAHEQETKAPKEEPGLLARLLKTIMSAALLLLLAQPVFAQTLAWSGTPQKREEAAAILSQGNHWSNITPSVAPLPEGIVGERLSGSPIYYPYWYWHGTARVGGWRGQSGFRGGRGRR